MKKVLFLSALLAMLSACGGGSDSSGSAGNGGTTGPQVDAFTTKVLSIAANAPDSGEPASIDTLTATLPEDTQPTPII